MDQLINFSVTLAHFQMLQHRIDLTVKIFYHFLIFTILIATENLKYVIIYQSTIKMDIILDVLILDFKSHNIKLIIDFNATCSSGQI